MKTNSKIWLWVISVLLLANLVLAGIQFWGDKRPKLEKRPFLGELLEFNSSQNAELKLLTDQHEYRIKAVSDSIRINKDQFFRGLREQKDVEQQNEFAQNIGRLEATRDKLTYVHFKNVRNICNEHQKIEFDKLLSEIMHPQGGPGRKNGPGGNGGPPPPTMGNNEGPPPMGKGEGGPPPPPPGK